jgi:MFS transporter, UMF1 family
MNRITEEEDDVDDANNTDRMIVRHRLAEEDAVEQAPSSGAAEGSSSLPSGVAPAMETLEEEAAPLPPLVMDATASLEDEIHPESQSGVPHDGPSGSGSGGDDDNEEAPPSSSSARRRRCRPTSSSSLLSCWFRGNNEAAAWCLDVTGRTTAVLSLGAFFMPALLQLARINAGCDPHDVHCSSSTTYGIKPGSWLTATQTVVSVLASPLLPIMGSIVDYTPRRLAVGRILSALFCSLLFPLIFVSTNTWFGLSIVLVLVFLTFEFQMVMAYSYLPELADNEDDLRNYTRNFTVISFAFVVLFVAILVGITAGLHIASDAVLVAQIAMSATFAVATVMLGVAWFRWFRPRPPLHPRQQGRDHCADGSSSSSYEPPHPSVWTAGFRKLGRSIKRLAATPSYRPLLWFNVAIAFSDASLQSLPTILITYFTDQLGFTSADIGVSVLLLLLSIAPAGYASAFTTKRLHNNAVVSSLFALLILVATTTVAAIILIPEPSSTTAAAGSGTANGDDTGGESSSSSSSKFKAYVLVVFWGIGNGWKWTADRLASATLCPPQQSGEFMGLYLFSTIVLTWLPPLVFTILNENGVTMQVGLATLNAWFLASAGAYLLMGRYRAAVEAIETFTGDDAARLEESSTAAGPVEPTLEEGCCGDGNNGSKVDATAGEA